MRIIVCLICDVAILWGGDSLLLLYIVISGLVILYSAHKLMNCRGLMLYCIVVKILGFSVLAYYLLARVML